MQLRSEEGRLTSRDFWQRRWDGEVAEDERVDLRYRMPFHALFDEVLPRDRSFIEIGCAPGRNLVYFHHHFGYRVAGLDFAATDATERTLRTAGIEDFELYDMDFLNDRPSNKYDIVASFGFIEHFDDLENVIARHVALVNEGGYVVLCVPNFRGLQYVVRYVLDRETLRTHNLEAMKPDKTSEILRKQGAKRIVYSDNYKTFRLWVDNENLSKRVLKGIRLMDAGFQKVAQLARVDNIPNRVVSPYCVTIAQF